MPQDLSIIRLVVQASIPVQIVIALLAFASLMSWAIIFSKRMVIRRARREADQFEGSFWSGGDLAQLYRGIESRGDRQEDHENHAEYAQVEPERVYRLRSADHRGAQRIHQIR